MNREEPARAPAHIRVQNLTVDLDVGGRSHPILGPINLEVAQGEFISVVGPTGCGKTTLLKTIAGLIPPSTGEIRISDRRVEAPQTDIGFAFQDPALMDWRTVLENLLLQAEVRRLELRKLEERARRLLASLGLSGSEDKWPRELSPVMQQRVSICRALVHDPVLLLLDEPFGGLDSLDREALALDLQRLWTAARKTFVVATKNIGEGVLISDRVIAMSPRPGRVSQTVTISLPRPRRLDKVLTPQLAEYRNQVRMGYHAEGVLP